MKLASLTFGEGVESIGSNAFQYATLSSVILPDSLVSIGRYAFAHTDLETVTIPANVTFIGAYAFYKAPLTSVTFRQKTGWSAGERRMSVGTAKTNATNLTDTTKYCTYDWSREATV